MSEHEELLPCPFCGSEARIYPAHDGSGFESVGCSNPDCEFEPSTDYAELSAAIAIWNKREVADTITTLRERVKVLEGALKPFVETLEVHQTGIPFSHCLKMKDLQAARAALKGGKT